ncbi:MAG TPA: Ku protein [Planctomycetaceae bacterium]|nr:Ku protein [Planctomycetaceae bacterium]
MAPRSTWKGYLKLSLVSVPVKAYTASSASSVQIHLNQLHAECHSRINYKKTCPIHGEVSNDDIVSGYEFAKGQYVIVDVAELDKLRTENDKAINLGAFVKADQIDPAYHTGKTYYLLPDGPIGQKPYALIHQSMLDEGIHGVGQVVLSSREQLVLVRPIGKLLAMTSLAYDTEVKKPESFEDELVETSMVPQELDLTKQLMSAFLKEDFDLAAYKDVYTEKLTELIEAKVQGRELVAPAHGEEPHVINLMEALKASVAQAQGGAVAEEEAAPAKKKMAKSEAPRAAAKRKKKSS